MAHRRRQGRVIALALAGSLSVHIGVLFAILTQTPPRRGDPGSDLGPAVLVTLERAPAEQASRVTTAGPAATTPASGPVAPVTEPSAPSSFAQPTGSPAGAGVGQQVVQSEGAGPAPGPAAGAAPGPVLKFDCLPKAGSARTVSRDPCAFRGATRDHLPEKVVKQASIDADKAAYYDRVLDTRKALANDWSRGNQPIFRCSSTYTKGRRPQHSLKVGPLPCFILPPEGPLDPEVFVEPIPSKNPDKPKPANPAAIPSEKLRDSGDWVQRERQ